MAHKTKSGRYRISVRIVGGRATKLFPRGTPKQVVDDYERKVKLDLIDPDLKEKKFREPNLATFAADWLETVVKVEKSFSHHLKQRQQVKLHLVPALGKKRLSEISSLDMVNLQRDLKAKGYAVQTISNVLACGSSLFKEAMLRGHVTVNPCAGLPRLKRDKKDFEVWSFAERDRFLALLYNENYRYFQLCAVALFSGMRPMELKGLLRDAIDFELSQIRVKRQWCSKQNCLVGYTKTRENRTVPIPKVVLDSLAEFKDRPGDTQLFPFMATDFCHKRLKPLMKEAGVRVISMHGMRHTFASQLLAKGCHLLEVKGLLGHKKLESTTVYLHFMAGRNQGVTDTLVTEMPWQKKEAKVVRLF